MLRRLFIRSLPRFSLGTVDKRGVGSGTEAGTALTSSDSNNLAFAAGTGPPPGFVPISGTVPIAQPLSVQALAMQPIAGAPIAPQQFVQTRVPLGAKPGSLLSVPTQHGAVSVAVPPGAVAGQTILKVAVPQLVTAAPLKDANVQAAAPVASAAAIPL